MEIKILNPIFSLIVDKQYVPMVSPLLSYKKTFYRKVAILDKNRAPTGKYRMQRQTYPKSTVTPAGVFFTGHIPVVTKYLQGKGITVTVQSPEWPYKTRSPQIPLTLRPDQERLVKNALLAHRGILKAGTGTGKTVMAGALISSIENIRTIFLCHTISLVSQTIKEFTRFGFDVGYITGTDKKLTGDVIVSTVQSFRSQPQELYDTFDMVIIDEAHRFAKAGGVYFEVGGRLKAPWRFGFTATPPIEEETSILLGGVIGPIIDEFSLQEGIEGGILAVPKLKIVKIPVDYKVKELRRYNDVYDLGIVKNRARNRMIVKTAKDLAFEDKTSLILINKIEHGHLLMDMGGLVGHDMIFIHGETEDLVREEVKECLIKKSAFTVIATTIWKEGINLPTLDCVIIAGGGKSEIGLLQNIGRGLRTAEGKDSVLIVDFLDLSHHYLISHFGERLSIYSDNGWL